MTLSTYSKQAIQSLTTPIAREKWLDIAAITVGTTLTAGVVATATRFVKPTEDWQPTTNPFKPLSAFFFPALVEEVFWRGFFLPRRLLDSSNGRILLPACSLLAIHVMSHPIAGRTVWPRGKGTFDDTRFLLLATIVLGGATNSFIVSGGSAWAAALTHALPVALWRDFFGGEARLSGKIHQY